MFLPLNLRVARSAASGPGRRLANVRLPNPEVLSIPRYCRCPQVKKTANSISWCKIPRYCIVVFPLPPAGNAL